nr:MAG TPA: hypothetical protein [Caudoviricetes sp.]
MCINIITNEMDSFGRITILTVTDRSNEPPHRPPPRIIRVLIITRGCLIHTDSKSLSKSHLSPYLFDYIHDPIYLLFEYIQLISSKYMDFGSKF